jgi:hypothetical protein
MRQLGGVNVVHADDIPVPVIALSQCSLKGYSNGIEENREMWTQQSALKGIVS